MCFPAVVEDELSDETDEFNLAQMPYRLVFKNIMDATKPCIFCGVPRCEGCAIPYTSMLNLE